MNNLYPFTFSPVYTNYPWGGDRIAKLYNREGTPQPCAESWEISAHKDGMSVVDRGEHKGRTLADICAEMKRDVVGEDCESEDKFPLLMKIIDAKRNLSLQVHPNESNASLVGGEPKTEMWYVLDAGKDSGIYAGLRSGVTPRIFREAQKANALEQLLEGVAAEPGKAMYVPGGLVHAIGAGCMVYEVQQSSNTTYRVYDWGFVGADGKPRELHTEKAMMVIDWRVGAPKLRAPIPEKREGSKNMLKTIVRSDFFHLRSLALAEPEEVRMDGRSFHAMFVCKGDASISWGGGESIKLPLGRSCLVPAKLGAYTLAPESDGATILITTL